MSGMGSRTGIAWIISGASLPTTGTWEPYDLAWMTIDKDDEDHGFGSQTSVVGDSDGDGIPEVLAGNAYLGGWLFELNPEP